MEILRFFTKPLSVPHFSTKPSYVDSAPIDTNQNEESGYEWIEVDEPSGIFLPYIKRRRQLLQLDQVHNVIHYDHYRQCMRIQDITLVTAVEEIDDNGHFQWWMSIQDARTVQVWIIHFSSLHRLQTWVNLLRSVTTAMQTHALISDIVLSNTACPPKIRISASLSSKETILEMHPEQETY